MKRKGKDTKSKAKGGGATSPSVTKPLTFAMVPQAHAQAGTRAPKSIVEQVRRYPKHSLLQFFPLLPTKVPKATARGTGGAAVEEEEEILLPSPLSEGDLGTDLNGRSWFAPELRTKSSHELHQLWYVLLMEKNRLATSWEEAKRLEIRGLMDMARTSLGNRNHRVRKSMARIKLVLNERRLALMQAQQQARMPIEANVAALQRQVEETPNSALWEDEAAAILASPEEEAQGMKGANTATRATAAERSGNQPKSPATGG
ncbi:hypothetical protein K437DRAFT_223526 [Tilletiaria anomala UBC 951]|uniref:Large ribosomal subunit protein uL29m n=1 Tax=Tilletiaria anomala (strain ATCC 24038 / CBS 436.72 / UBC 951) TaxID=1037660 RepID=A0A066W225_TILAU|nr:uncharacterized protein K437DRAFT_223526 [Tilletiaria anomala UBC 951]KDN46608.1 hypothetical protein K437DRAFT_223526 [Tilletiaria anomala UBC 951]